MIISEKEHPPLGIMGGSVHSYERSSDPFHRDAMPDEFKSRFPAGKRRSGWMALDWCGNAIGFFADGEDFPDQPAAPEVGGA